MSGVSIETVGPVGYLTLAKPATLNAITLDMVESLHHGLHEHQQNTSVAAIVLRAASEKAFCAGGDMKHIRQLVLNEDKDSINHFFAKEYALNLAIANCSKPYISLIDGVAMGGGLGLSVHGQFVVATENATMAMPESRIGFFPDVGASYFLQNLPYNSGAWLALTAIPVKGQHTIQVGLATHYIRSAQLQGLIKQLETLNPDNSTATHSLIKHCLDSLADNNIDDAFSDVLQRREEWFAGDDIESIKARLQNASAQNDDARNLLTLIEKGSPHSIAITQSLFEKNQGKPLQQCLVAELELTMQAVFHPDLAEGVRAVLVDKDHHAKWA